MNTVVSPDGTVIAFDRFGDGPPVIMVVGAFNTRPATEPLAKALAQPLHRAELRPPGPRRQRRHRDRTRSTVRSTTSAR